MSKEQPSEVRVMSRREALRQAAQRFPKEKPDPTPVAAIAQRQRPLTLREEMQRFIREQASEVAEMHGHDSFEDFDDFEIDDEDPDLTTPYTVSELHSEFEETLDGQPTAEDLSEEAEEGAGVQAGSAPGEPSAGDPAGIPATHAGEVEEQQ